MRPRTEPHGFTLIEVLVAFAIAAILLTVVLRTLTAGLTESDRSAAYTRATILAESALDAMGVVAPLRDGESADLTDGRFHIHAVTERYHDAATDAAGQYLVLYRLSVTVSWGEGRWPRAISLSTLRLGPAG